jgi:transposase
MKDEQRQAAKKRMMALMQEGYSWQEAARLSGIQTSRSTAYRWFQQFRTQGEAALHDGRHGHIAKMHKPIREWLAARCRQEPNLPSSSLQHELNVHFGVLVSITHLNRIRAAQGLERQPARMEKNGLGKCGHVYRISSEVFPAGPSIGNRIERHGLRPLSMDKGFVSPLSPRPRRS